MSKAEGDLKEEQRGLATLARTYFILAESLVPSKDREIALKKAEEYNIKSLFICERYDIVRIMIKFFCFLFIFLNTHCCLLN